MMSHRVSQDIGVGGDVCSLSKGIGGKRRTHPFYKLYSLIGAIKAVASDSASFVCVTDFGNYFNYFKLLNFIHNITSRYLSPSLNYPLSLTKFNQWHVNSD